MNNSGNSARRSRNASRRIAPSTIRNAPEPKVSVIIPAKNEKRTIAQVIVQARKVHPETEVIVVANGSTDGTARIARRMGAKVLAYPEPLGHDVGRAIGAKAASGDILLFIDADFVIPAAKLKPYVRAVERGYDIVLNRLGGTIRRHRVHPVILAKKALNIMIAKPELGISSMLVIPHAISRKALEQIGPQHLAVPPKAQAVAASLGLRFKLAKYINVSRKNARRPRSIRYKVKRLVLGDHLEAIDWWLRQSGNPRAGYSDLDRKRESVNGT